MGGTASHVTSHNVINKNLGCRKAFDVQLLIIEWYVRTSRSANEEHMHACGQCHETIESHMLHTKPSDQRTSHGTYVSGPACKEVMYVELKNIISLMCKDVLN